MASQLAEWSRRLVVSTSQDNCLQQPLLLVVGRETCTNKNCLFSHYLNAKRCFFFKCGAPESRTSMKVSREEKAFLEKRRQAGKKSGKKSVSEDEAEDGAKDEAVDVAEAILTKKNESLSLEVE